MIRALVSIHDVMPSTQAAVTAMLRLLQREIPQLCSSQITLLVVPGKPWCRQSLAWLHALARAGHPLAGHGWHHAACRPRTPYHLLHSLLLSRNAAEHLSLSHQALTQLVQNCAGWFLQQGLPLPELYVPPAWAAGKLTPSQWQALPFQQLETLRGVHNLRKQTLQLLPLTGYEADTALRVLMLKRFNRWNLRRADFHKRPVRIALHPFDLQYALAQNAIKDLAAVDEFITYRELGL